MKETTSTAKKQNIAIMTTSKKQLEKANATIDGMKDYDAVKPDVAKYQQEAENAKKEAAAKVRQLELQAKVKDFTSGKKFVNDLTRDAINAQLEATLNDDNKGKRSTICLKHADGKNGYFQRKHPDPADSNKHGSRRSNTTNRAKRRSGKRTKSDMEQI